MGGYGKHAHIKLLTVSLINIEPRNQRYVNILFFMILYVWNLEAENYHRSFTERRTERWI